jgi:hypothetical protein
MGTGMTLGWTYVRMGRKYERKDGRRKRNERDTGKEERG